MEGLNEVRLVPRGWEDGGKVCGGGGFEGGDVVFVCNYVDLGRVKLVRVTFCR